MSIALLLPHPPNNAAAWQLEAMLNEAGLRLSDVQIHHIVRESPPGDDFKRHNGASVERGLRKLRSTIRDERPSIVIACGAYACYALIGGWPTKHSGIYGAYSAFERRGYFWEEDNALISSVVLSTLHPEDALARNDPNGINRMLMVHDLERGKQVAVTGIKKHRPARDVRIVDTMQKAAKVRTLDCFNPKQAIRLASDIESYDSERTACIGFGITRTKAYVFTPETFVVAHEILRNPLIELVFHNGFYDAYMLLTRDNVRVRGYTDDTQVGWHCCWPEVAGQSNKGGKRTQKSLSFLNSVFGYEPWWKDYDFATPEEMYQLNGKDCCVTLEIHEALQRERKRLDVCSIYEHEMSLVWPCIEVQSRGFRLDADLLAERERKLTERQAELDEKLRTLLVSVLEARREELERPDLMWTTKACKCCGGGARKSQACWSCAGFEKAPSKKELLAGCTIRTADGNAPAFTKAKLEELILEPCEACAGAGSAEHFNLNLNSGDQLKDILYNMLKLPKRYKGQQLTTDEEALKNLLGML